jgi:hypothetical protein
MKVRASGGMDGWSWMRDRARWGGWSSDRARDGDISMMDEMDGRERDAARDEGWRKDVERLCQVGRGGVGDTAPDGAVYEARDGDEGI